MPMICHWTGLQQELSFDRLVSERSHFPDDYLIDLFGKLVSESKIPVYSKQTIGFIKTSEDK